jgi:hypothetical protein
MSEYTHVRLYLDPLGLVRTEHGSEWEIELVLSDDPDRDPPSLADPVCRLDAQRARALAQELLELARDASRPHRGKGAMTVTPSTPPPLSDELDRLLRRLRLPYVRRAAPEVLATANSQRWEHAEVLRVLLAEEAAGRDKPSRVRPKVTQLPSSSDCQKP